MESLAGDFGGMYDLFYLHFGNLIPKKVPSRELIYPLLKGTFEDDFPFPKVGYVSSQEGSLENLCNFSLTYYWYTSKVLDPYFLRFEGDTPKKRNSLKYLNTGPNRGIWRVWYISIHLP